MTAFSVLIGKRKAEMCEFWVLILKQKSLVTENIVSSRYLLKFPYYKLILNWLLKFVYMFTIR